MKTYRIAIIHQDKQMDRTTVQAKSSKAAISKALQECKLTDNLLGIRIVETINKLTH